MRIMANPRIHEQALSLKAAWEFVASWLELPSVWVPLPTERHAELVGQLLERETSHHLVADAHLAALAIEHGLILCTTDRGFARFEGLRWQNPLETVGH